MTRRCCLRAIYSAVPSRRLTPMPQAQLTAFFGHAGSKRPRSTDVPGTAATKPAATPEAALASIFDHPACLSSTAAVSKWGVSPVLQSRAQTCGQAVDLPPQSWHQVRGGQLRPVGKPAEAPLSLPEGAQYLHWGQLLVYASTEFAAVQRQATAGMQAGKRVRLVGVDVDSTLVTCPSGAKFPKDASDWVPECGGVVLMSNQAGVGKGRVAAELVMSRLGAIADALDAYGIPCAVLAATHDDMFRKPRPGMWLFAVEALFGAPESSLDRRASLYIGDAMGRLKQHTAGQRGKTGRADFSAGDLKFALNVGCQATSPEACFQRASSTAHAQPWNEPSIVEKHLAWVPVQHLPVRSSAVVPVPAPAGQPECVLLVGAACTGKSTLARLALPEHTRINQDTLGTRAACVARAKEAWAAGRSVVVDATNRELSVRGEWLGAARDAGASCRAIRVQADKPTAMHLCAFRVCNPSFPPEPEPGKSWWHAQDAAQRAVPEVVLHTHFKQLEGLRLDADPGLRSVQDVQWAAELMLDSAGKQAGPSFASALLLHHLR